MLWGKFGADVTLVMRRLPFSSFCRGLITAPYGYSGAYYHIPCIGSIGSARGYKSVLKSLRKQLGQHLLRNPDVVKRIVDSAQLQPHETVLEIGPGTGNMTIHMLEKCAAVFAVELDERMFEAVTGRVRQLYVTVLWRL